MKTINRKFSFVKVVMLCLAFLSCVATGGLLCLIENSTHARNSDETAIERLTSNSPATVLVGIVENNGTLQDVNGNNLYYHSRYGVVYTDGTSYYSKIIDGRYFNQITDITPSELLLTKNNADISATYKLKTQINHGETYLLTDLQRDRSLANNLVYTNDTALNYSGIVLPANSKIFSDGTNYFYYTDGTNTNLMPIYEAGTNTISHFETYANVSDPIIDNGDENDSDNINIFDGSNKAQVQKIYLNVTSTDSSSTPETLSSMVGVEGVQVGPDVYATDANSAHVLNKEQKDIYNGYEARYYSDELEGYVDSDGSIYKVNTHSNHWYFDGDSAKLVSSSNYYLARNNSSNAWTVVTKPDNTTAPYYCIIQSGGSSSLQELTANSPHVYYYNTGTPTNPTWNELVYVSGNKYIHTSVSNVTTYFHINATSGHYIIDSNANDTFDDGEIDVKEKISGYYYNNENPIRVSISNTIKGTLTDGTTWYIEHNGFSLNFDRKITSTSTNFLYLSNQFTRISTETTGEYDYYFNSNDILSNDLIKDFYTSLYYTKDGSSNIVITTHLYDNNGLLRTNPNYKANYHYTYDTYKIAPNAQSFDYFYGTEDGSYTGVATSAVEPCQYYYTSDESKIYVLSPFTTINNALKVGFNAIKSTITENTLETSNTSLRISIGEYGTKITDPSGISVAIHHDGVALNGVSLAGDATNGYYLTFNSTSAMEGNWEVYFGCHKENDGTINTTNQGYYCGGNGPYSTYINFSIMKESDYYTSDVRPTIYDADTIGFSLSNQKYYNSNYYFIGEDTNLANNSTIPYVRMDTTKFNATVIHTAVNGDQTTYEIHRTADEVGRNSRLITLPDTDPNATEFKFYFTELGYYQISYTPIVKINGSYSTLDAINLDNWLQNSFELTNMGYQLIYRNKTVDTPFVKYKSILTLADYANGTVSNTRTTTLSPEILPSDFFSTIDGYTSTNDNLDTLTSNAISTNQPPVSFIFSGKMHTDSFYWFKSSTGSTWTKTANLQSLHFFTNAGTYLVCVKYERTRTDVPEEDLYQYFAFTITNSQASYSLKNESDAIILNTSGATESTLVPLNCFSDENITLEMNSSSEFDVLPEISIWYSDENYTGSTKFENDLGNNELEVITTNQEYTFKSSRRWTVQIHYGPNLWTNKSTFINFSFIIDKNPLTYIPYSNNEELDDNIQVLGSDKIFKLEYGNSVVNNIAYKNSGARISATYTYTPIVERTTAIANDDEDKLISQDSQGSKDYLVTNYILDFGQTTGNLSYTYGTEINCATKPGLYQFTLTDQAGNTSSYYIYLDNVRPEYKVTDARTDANAPLYKLEWGSFKAIEMVGAHTAPLKVCKDGITDFEEDKPIITITSTDYLISQIGSKNLNFYAQGDNSLNDQATNKTRTFDGTTSGGTALNPDHTDYLILNDTSFLALKTKRNEGQFVLYIADVLGNQANSQSIIYNFDLSQTTAYVKNNNTMASNYQNDTYPILVNNKASNLDQMFITSLTSGNSTEGPWTVEYIKITFYALDYTTSVYDATGETIDVYDSSHNNLSTLSPTEIIKIINKDASNRVTNGKYVIERKYANGFVAPNDLFEAGVDIDEQIKEWTVYIDRIKPIEYIDQDTSVGSNNKLILQETGANLAFSDYILDGETISLDTNLLPVTLSFLTNKYGDSFDFSKLEITIDNLGTTNIDDISLNDSFTNGTYRITLSDSVNDSVFDKAGNNIQPNTVSFVFKATPCAPQAEFRKTTNSITSTLILDDLTTFVLVKSSNSDTVTFVIEDPADYYQAKVDSSHIYQLTNENPSWTLISSNERSHDNQTNYPDGTTRMIYSFTVPITNDGVYSFKIQFTGDSSYYNYNGINHYSQIYTIVIDTTAPQTNITQLITADSYLAETETTEPAADYAFNVNENQEFTSATTSSYDDTFTDIYGENNFSDKVKKLDTYKVFFREVRTANISGTNLSLPSLLPGDENYNDDDYLNPRFSGNAGGYYFEMSYGTKFSDALSEAGFQATSNVELFEIIEIDAAGNYTSYYVYYEPFTKAMQISFVYNNYFTAINEPSSTLHEHINTLDFTSNKTAIINSVGELGLLNIVTANKWFKATLPENIIYYNTSDSTFENFETWINSNTGSGASYTLSIYDRHDIDNPIVIILNFANTDDILSVSTDTSGAQLQLTINNQSHLYAKNTSVTYYSLNNLTPKTKSTDDASNPKAFSSSTSTVNYLLNKTISYSTAIYYFDIIDNFGSMQRVSISEQSEGDLFFIMENTSRRSPIIETLSDGKQSGGVVGKQIGFEFNLLYYYDYVDNNIEDGNIGYTFTSSNGNRVLLFNYLPHKDQEISITLTQRTGENKTFIITQYTILPILTFYSSYDEEIIPSQTDANGFSYDISSLNSITINHNATGCEYNPQTDYLYWAKDSITSTAIPRYNIFSNSNSISLDTNGEYRVIVKNDLGTQITYTFKIDYEATLFYSVRSSSGSILNHSIVDALYEKDEDTDIHIKQYFTPDENFKIYADTNKRIRFENTTGIIYENNAKITIADKDDAYSFDSTNNVWIFKIKSEVGSGLDYEEFIQISLADSAPAANLKWNNINVATGTNEQTAVTTGRLTYSTNVPNGNYLTAYIYYGNMDRISTRIIPRLTSASEFESTIDLEFKNAGTYYIQLIDLAGNMVMFNGYKMFTVYNLSKATGKVNNLLSLMNDVVISNSAVINIDNIGKYNTLNYTITRDGIEYLTGTDQSFTLSDIGTYQINIEGTVIEGTTPRTMTSSYRLIVVNPNSARLGFEYSVASNYTIDKVYQSVWNTAGRNELSTSNYSKNKLTLSHLKNGNGYYTVKVIVDFDADYRINEEFEFNVLIANAIPVVTSNRELGTTTKKDITLSINPKAIYNQQGNCKVVIINRDTQASQEFLINASNASTEVQELAIQDVGIYDIQVWSESGESLFYWTSITYKTPLNTVSIILIVIGCLAGLAAIVLFIMLRTRMKVR